MTSTERIASAQSRRALVALAAVLVVGGVSITSPTMLSSHSAPSGNNLPAAPAITSTPSATTPTPSYPTPTVEGTSDPGPTETTSSVPTATLVPTGPTATLVPPKPTATMTNLPKITHKRITVPFTTITKKDPELAKGTTKVLRAGVTGINEVTYTDGKLTATKVIKKPVAKLVAVGTKTVKPWISAKQCAFDRHTPIVRVTVTDPDKVGYRLWITWGLNKRDFTATGTQSFEYRPDWSGMRWHSNCEVWIG